MLQSARVYTHTKKVKDPTFQLDSRLFEYITRRGEADQRHKPYYGRSGSAPQKLMGSPMERVRFPFAEQSQMPAGHSEPPVAPTTTSPAGDETPTGSFTTVTPPSRSCASSSLLARLCRSSINKLRCGFDVGSGSPLKALRLDGTAAPACTGSIRKQQGPPLAARIKGIELVRSLYRAAVGTSSKERALSAAGPPLRQQERAASPRRLSTAGNTREASKARFLSKEAMAMVAAAGADGAALDQGQMAGAVTSRQSKHSTSLFAEGASPRSREPMEEPSLSSLQIPIGAASPRRRHAQLMVRAASQPGQATPHGKPRPPPTCISASDQSSPR